MANIYRNKLLQARPVSSADCERRFSQMTIYHTSGRNRLLVSSESDMMMAGVNGPLLDVWNAQKYVISWLKAGRHGTLDKAIGIAKKKEPVSHRAKLQYYQSDAKKSLSILGLLQSGTNKSHIEFVVVC